MIALTLISVICVVGLLVLSGVALVGSRLERDDWLEFLGSCGLCGLAVVGVAASLGALCGLPFPWAPAMALGVGSICGLRRIRASVPRGRGPRLPALLALAALLMLVVTEAATRPYLEGDEVYVWGIKSSVLARFGSPDPGLLPGTGARGAAYPLALPTTGALALWIRGELAGPELRIVGIFGWILAISGIWRLAKARLERWAAEAVLVASAAAPLTLFLAPSFMGDLALVGALAAAAAFVQRRGSAWICALHAAAAAQIRVDGIALGLVLAAFAGLAAKRRRLVTGVIAAAFVILTAAPWWLYLVSLGRSPVTGITGGISAGSTGLPLAQIAERTVLALASMGRDWLPMVSPMAFHPTPSVPLGGMLILCVVLPFLRSRRRHLAPGIFALGVAMVLAQAVAMASVPWFGLNLLSFSPRGALHLLPALLLMAFAAQRVRAHARDHRSAHALAALHN